MEKIGIILWNIWNHRNQVVFKKIQPNPFLVIEKATYIFQNLQDYLMDSYHLNKGNCVTRRVGKWIQWIPPINGRFKLKFDGSRVQNNSVVGWVIRSILKMAECKQIGNSLIIIPP